MTLVAALMIIGATSLQAKNVPEKAAILPAEIKEAVTCDLNYPRNAQNNLIEGEVWLKLCVDETSTLKLIDLSATNPELGEYVRKHITSIKVDHPQCKQGQLFYLKVKFDLQEM